MTNPTLPRGKLTQLDASAIKRLLWRGTKQSVVAAQFQVSQPTISYILRGTQWASTQWPDGTDGPLPLEQRLLLTKPLSSANEPPTKEAEIAAGIIEKKATEKEEEEAQALFRAIKGASKKGRD